jgi:hypothetical protein
MKRPAFSLFAKFVLPFVYLVVTPTWCSHTILDCGKRHFTQHSDSLFYCALYAACKLIHFLGKTGGTSIAFSGESTNSDEITLVPGGSIDLSVTARSSQPTPEGVMLMKLIRRESDNAIVPCLDGISGSW